MLTCANSPQHSVGASVAQFFVALLKANENLGPTRREGRGQTGFVILKQTH